MNMAFLFNRQSNRSCVLKFLLYFSAVSWCPTRFINIELSKLRWQIWRSIRNEIYDHVRLLVHSKFMNQIIKNLCWQWKLSSKLAIAFNIILDNLFSLSLFRSKCCNVRSEKKTPHFIEKHNKNAFSVKHRFFFNASSTASNWHLFILHHKKSSLATSQ